MHVMNTLAELGLWVALFAAFGIGFATGRWSK